MERSMDYNGLEWSPQWKWEIHSIFYLLLFLLFIRNKNFKKNYYYEN